MKNLTVEQFFEENKERLKLTSTAGRGSFKRLIVESNLHRPGLALTGFVDVFTFQRVQIIGNTENKYLIKLSDEERVKSIVNFFSFEIPCVIVTENNKPPAEFLSEAKKHKISIFQTPFTTTQLMHLLSEYLDDRFAPNITIHGSLVDVYGVGVMFTGRSGIGKSEIALDLVERGHRLVSDDVVNIARMAQGVLIGSASEMLQHHMEIRGVGIVDVQSIFGIRAIRMQKRLEVEVQLEEWDQSENYERTGIEEGITTILGVEIPLVKLPIFPGKNVTVIAEVVALQQLLKINGINPAKRFNDRLINKMQDKSRSFKPYLYKDYE